jgi:hypothetical protein
MEYSVRTDLNFLNKGNEPTFALSNRKEVIDLTLGTDMIGNLVTNWHVSDQIFCQTTDTQYFKLVTWKLPGPHIATPGEPTGNPAGKT